MICIVEEEKDIVKYEVEINREELEKIQKEMIDKCSRKFTISIKQKA